MISGPAKKFSTGSSGTPVWLDQFFMFSFSFSSSIRAPEVETALKRSKRSVSDRFCPGAFSLLLTPGSVVSGAAGDSTTLVPCVRAVSFCDELREASSLMISASSSGGFAAKYRSSEAKSRKYSAMAFIAPNESVNPSKVQENVP